MTDPRLKLENTVRVLHSKRLEIAEITNNIENVSLKIAKTKNGMYRDTLSTSRDLAFQELAKLEKELRELALEIGEELNEKRPAPGLVITKTTRVDLVDEAAAIEWLTAHHPELLETKIKTGDFNRLMKALANPPDFVNIKIEEFGGVRIDKDLADKYPLQEGSNEEQNVPF